MRIINDFLKPISCKALIGCLHFLFILGFLRLFVLFTFSHSLMQENRYGSLAEVEKDVSTMVKNAHTFNERGSQIYKVIIGDNPM